MRITIIDYGMGNLKSIYNALMHLSESDITIADDASKLSESDAFILPGVGAFEDAMQNLEKRGFREALNREVLEKKKPILGICLGMQLLFSDSEEGSYTRGLGWIEGNVIMLKPGKSFRVPHVGWNDLIVKDHTMFQRLEEDKNVYFVHSYFADTPKEYITATFSYGKEFTAAVAKDNIWGMQFHPEKSQKVGFTLLKNYLEFCRSY